MDMARRGFFAELQYQSRVAARQQAAEDRSAARAAAAAAREAERAQKEYQRAKADMARAADSQRKRLEKEAREAHLAAREAEAEEQNRKLEEIYDDIDSLLANTLSVDDYVELSTLKVSANHPPFDRPELETPIPPPSRKANPPEPQFVEPPAPSGLSALFGKKKHRELVELARTNHENAVANWKNECEAAEKRHQAAIAKHVRVEELRQKRLAEERARYASDCAKREEDAAEKNKKLDALIANLGYGSPDAVQEYVSIVLSNSAYPDHFQVNHEFEFNPASAELRLKVFVPGPGSVPTTKAYKYVKGDDEIVTTDLPQKACRERYSSAIYQVALRSFHEIFESDRRGLIHTISMEVGTATTDPATGRETYVPFVFAAAARESFITYDLAAVVPLLTLERLGASVSKNPFALTPASAPGIRSS